MEQNQNNSFANMNTNDFFTNLFNNINFPQPQVSIPLNDTQQNNSNNNLRMRYVNRQLDTIYELIIRYNDIMTLYQRNMTQMINLININNNSFRQYHNEIRGERSSERGRQRNYFSYDFNVPFRQGQNNLFTTRHNIPTYQAGHTFVPLTTQQLDSITTTFFYSEDMQSELNDNRCPISLDNYQNDDVLCRITHCNHVFKKENLLRWLRRNSNCPVCRHDLRSSLRANTRNPRTNNRGPRTNNTRSPRTNNNGSPRRNNRRNPRENTQNHNTNGIRQDESGNSVNWGIMQNQFGNSLNWGVMRDQSGNVIDASNNPYTRVLESEITSMMETMINSYNNTNGNYDVSFNIQTLYPNVESTTNDNRQTDSDDEVILDNISVD